MKSFAHSKLMSELLRVNGLRKIQLTLETEKLVRMCCQKFDRGAYAEYKRGNRHNKKLIEPTIMEARFRCWNSDNVSI